MSSLASIQTQFAAYNPATVDQTEIKAMLSVYINSDPQIPDYECISGFAKILHLPCSIREKLFLVHRFYTVSSATIFS
jgi:hypothetical protein